MIVYFTGTGNSRYLARLLAERLGDEITDIALFTREKKGARLSSDKPFVFVVPTYASYIPVVVEDFLKKSDFSGNDKIYFLLTCGASFARAGTVRRLAPILREKSLVPMGVAGIVMPENYITLFAAPSEEHAKSIVEKGAEKTAALADAIERGESLYTKSAPSFMTTVFNRLFYRFFVKDKPYYATDACVSCEKCARLCPLANITIEAGRPVWHGDCTQCMACIGGCPKHAIEYGNKAKGKRRYYLD